MLAEVDIKPASESSVLDIGTKKKKVVFSSVKHLVLFIYFYFILFVFLEPYPWHMEVPRLGVELEL